MYPLLFQLYQWSHLSSEGGSRIDSAKLRLRLDAITSSLNNLGDTIGNAFEVNAYTLPLCFMTFIPIEKTSEHFAAFVDRSSRLFVACLSSHNHLFGVYLCRARSNQVQC